MRDATGAVQSALVLGGSSEIAEAIIAALAERRLERVVLAARDTGMAASRARALEARGVQCEVVAFDADDVAAADRVLDAAGPVDLVLVAFGVLGEPFDVAADPASTAALARTNTVGAMTATHAAARALVRQGQGTLVVLSSVAAVRVRAENAAYGASKAGLDGFAQGLADAVHGSGVEVMIVRPGFVRTRMTAGRPEAPFATTPAAVAADVVRGLRRRDRVAWSPPILRWVFVVLSRLPAPLWRRLSR